MADVEKSFMRGKGSKESLKKRFEKVLDRIWQTPGGPLPEESLPELPKVPLTKDQIDSTRDPLDVLADKLGNEKLDSPDK